MRLFVLLVLLSHVSMVTAVAGCHSDRDKDHRTRQNCTAADFTDVPAGFEPSTKVLLFPNNRFSGLSWSSLQIFTAIYEIDLTGNQVPEVTSGVAAVLPSLSVLRLGSNRLRTLSDGSFSACPGLTELYLHNNAIHSLSDHAFSGLGRLEILDLSSNLIEVLPELLLHPLPAIETLYLEGNKIKVMPDDWFSQKEEVPYLYLSANPWACSCSLGYLHQYLDDNESNIYTRDGPLIKSDVDSVVCDSPPGLKDKPVITLEPSDLCPPARGDLYQPATTTAPHETTSAETRLPASSTVSPPPAPPTSHPVSALPSGGPASVELHTEYRRVVTWSFTRPVEWSRSVGRTAEPLGQSPPPSSEGPPTTRRPAQTSITSTVQVVTATPTSPWWGAEGPGSRTRAVGGAGLFCFWLFSGGLLLCGASVVAGLGTVARLLTWYRRAYEPLRLARRRGVRLLTYGRREEVTGGVTALYRSVLFIHKEEEVERGGGEGGADGLVVHPAGPRGGEEEGGEYRKTLYRLFSKEEEVEGGRSLLEEGGGRRGGAGTGSRKRYSVILREEAGGGREEQDWVVGGWEGGGAQEEPRSSWGEWLTGYLPSMPWGVTAPPQGEADQ